MQKYLEFREEEVPEKNPNPKNDIYRPDGAKGDIKGYMLFIVIGSGCLVAGVYYLPVKIMAIFCWILGISMIHMGIKAIYQREWYRRKTIEKGLAYSGVIVGVYENTKKIVSGSAQTTGLTTYGIIIKYADTILRVKGLDGYPGKYLENPYCTVYVWNGKAIAADFKVRDEYIAANGKEYCLKSVRRRGNKTCRNI